MTQQKIKFDFTENTIKVDEKFYKKAQNYGTEEYRVNCRKRQNRHKIRSHHIKNKCVYNPGTQYQD